MEPQSTEIWSIGLKFLGEYGLPVFLVMYLLNSFQKKIDKLISLVDRLTGVILTMAKTDRSDVDDRTT